MAAKRNLSNYHSNKSLPSQQDTNMISNLISHSNNPIRTIARFQSPSSNSFKLKLQESSKSYSNKLKQRQKKRLIPRSAQYSPESCLFPKSDLHSYEFMTPEDGFKLNTHNRAHLTDPRILGNQYEHLESSESFLKIKSWEYSDISTLSYNRTPKEEVLLNEISTERPKMELPISPIKKSPRSSRTTTPIHPMKENHLKEYEKFTQLQMKLSDQNDKYIKLERKYREAMAKKTRLEIFYEDMIKKLTRELTELKDYSVNPSVQEVEGVINSVLSEVNDVRSKVNSIEDRIKSFVINFS